MKVSKAIEILEEFIPRQWWQEPYHVRDATKLGLEALKRVQRLREDALFEGGVALSGETPEEEVKDE